jgi:hypothetical protein
MAVILLLNVVRVTQQRIIYQESVFAGQFLSIRCQAMAWYVTVFMYSAWFLQQETAVVLLNNITPFVFVTATQCEDDCVSVRM